MGMSKIEIGVGFVLSALSGFGIFQNLYVNIAIACIGVALIFHGLYELAFKPYVFLDKRLAAWLKKRNWKTNIEKKEPFYFIIWAEDDDGRKVAITKGKEDKGILAFSARIPVERDLLLALDKLTQGQRRQLLEDIKVFFASKNMSYSGADWPLTKLAVQGALPIDGQLSEHLIDLKAKEITMAIIGVRSLVRKATNKLE